MTDALLIAGHGSRDADGVSEFLSLAQLFRDRQSERPVEIGFLEFARPTIQEGIKKLVSHGADRVIVLPGVLMAAGHAKNDMACEVERARETYPHIEILMGRALDIDPRLLDLCRIRFEECLADGQPIDRKNTLLLVVGRGSGDPDANGNIAKVTRFLHEGYGVGWSSYCFSGITAPLLDEALPVCEKMGYRHIIVQPYYLFTGVLLKKIHHFVAERAVARPELDIRATAQLEAHPLLLDVLEERATEAVEGTSNMNCSLCRYRVRIIGHEHAHGEAQQPHHHHVQGLHSHVHGLLGSGVTKEEPVPSGPHAWGGDLVSKLGY